jgi:hypothetical protein
MRFLFLLSVLVHVFSASAQNSWEIELSNNITNTRMGVWKTGDYSIFVELDSINNYLNQIREGHARSYNFYCDNDSNLASYFEASLNRYEIAVHQLNSAPKGFDIQALIVYDGIEIYELNTSKSTIVERLIKQFVEKGNAIVYYKGQRIFKLTCLSSIINSENTTQSISDILNRGHEIKTYFDNPENCIFSEYYILGW